MTIPAIICSKCSNAVSEAARLKKIALVADTFFRKQSLDEDEAIYNELKVKLEQPAEIFTLIEEHIEENIDEVIEYDDTVEALDEEMFSGDEKIAYIVTQENYSMRSPRKPYAPRKQGGGRQEHRCECGLTFSSNQRLHNHIRVRHEDVPESEMLACNICDRKSVEIAIPC